MSLRWRAIWVGMDSENLSITDRGTQWPRAMASPEAGKTLCTATVAGLRSHIPP